MSTHESLAADFERFMGAVTGNPSPAQIKIMRDSFYAGAICSWSALNTSVKTEDEQMYLNFDKEIDTYIKEKQAEAAAR